ncbi:MAG: HXXEE domain-containing protein [Clostridia bacterium]|nr:HXXEE domain-containing protein [Clostridia bacterium]
MREYLLFLPLIFIFHDMEEIVGFGWFFRRNPWLYKRFPKVMKNYIGFTETGMAIGVYEELLVFGGAALLAFFLPNNITYALWFGLLLALTGHFAVHIGHTLYIRKYIPSFITSAISLPLSVLLLYKASKVMAWDVWTIIVIVISVFLMIGNFFLIHTIMHKVNSRFNSPDKNYNVVPIPGRN